MPHGQENVAYHIHQLCSRLAIGTPKPPLSRVLGGFHHKLWRLETDAGVFAVKQLSAEIDTHNPECVRRYNLTEAIAEAFAQRAVAAVFALGNSEGYLQVIEDTGYLVYPWCDGSVREEREAPESHALVMGAMLARMHQADIRVPGAIAQEFETLPDNAIIEWVRRAAVENTLYGTTLDAQLPLLLSIASSHRAAVPVLARHLVISHGDLNPKNVLWDAIGEAHLIDWESAGKVNPTYELLLAALEWSGIDSHYDDQLCRRFLAAYQQAGGVVERDNLEAAFQCALGEWLIWLVYNIARVFERDPGERTMGAAQIERVLPTILHLNQLKPALLAGWRCQ